MKSGVLKIICIFFISLIATGVFLTNIKVDCVEYFQRKNDVPFGEITQNHGMLQEIRLINDVNISKIDILMATYNRANNCNVNFELYRNGEKVYHYQLKDASTLIDNSYYTLNNVNVDYKIGDELYLSITSEAENGNAVTVWMNSKSQDRKAFVYDGVNDTKELSKGTAMIKVYAKESAMEFLNKNFCYCNNYVVCILLGPLLTFIILVFKQLLPEKCDF
ncbi:MAG: hypothetical protein VB018_09195 [Lachnospiraceae bacterium]|nr:hypothetical protein [Lachnospiraceae bacterium]